jgi:uncharacterized membrane protein
MNLKRIMRHLSCGRANVYRVLPPRALESIERAIAATEMQHDGQIRFAVEAALDWQPLLAGQTARDRAVEVFSELRVWDTELNNCVLIYLLLADRDVEIVADRGIHARVGEAAWEAICGAMEREFAEGRFEAGAIVAVRAISDLLATHFPPQAENPDELPNRPVLL